MIVERRQRRATDPGPRRPGLADTRLWRSDLLCDAGRLALGDAPLATRSVDAGADLLREGERSDALFMVLDGWVCRYSTTDGGARQISGLAVPGDLANLDALLLDRIDYGVRVIKRATVLVLPRERALALAAADPGIARAFTRLALVENAVLGRWSLCLGRMSSRERLAHLFCELSLRLGGGDVGESRFEFPLTQEHLADALGLTPVHVNRVMQQLRVDGLIATANRMLTIPDVAKLRRVAGFDPRYLHLEQASPAAPSAVRQAVAL